MNAGPAGFRHASVSKLIIIACAVASVLFGTQTGSLSFTRLSYRDIVKKHQLWRIFASSFVFSSASELFFGLYLLYFFRVFERHKGSNKYTVFAIYSTTITALLSLLAIYLLGKYPSPLGISPGPYGIIFASFVQFYFDIPTSTQIPLFGASLSDKCIVYLAGLQLLISSRKQSLIPVLCGLLAGIAYRVMGIDRNRALPAMLKAQTS